MRLEDLNVLYAEDEKGIQSIVTEILELYVNSVITANDGEEALYLYETHKPSILLMDINMPYLDGLSALKKIRENDIHTPAIIMTAHTEQKYLLHAVELYITKYLVKPFDKNALLEALNSCVELLGQKHSKKILLCENIFFDYEKQSILRDNEEISLNKKERILLNLFLNNKNKTLRYDEIEYHVWEDMATPEAMKSLIKDLRKKTSKELIKNVAKIGYTLEIKDDK